MDLDDDLRALGIPAAAAPRTSSTAILVRAMPPVPVAHGLAGWKLAGVVGAAVAAGWVGGVVTGLGGAAALQASADPPTVGPSAPAGPSAPSAPSLSAPSAPSAPVPTPSFASVVPQGTSAVVPGPRPSAIPAVRKRGWTELPRDGACPAVLPAPSDDEQDIDWHDLDVPATPSVAAVPKDRRTSTEPSTGDVAVLPKDEEDVPKDAARKTSTSLRTGVIVYPLPALTVGLAETWDVAGPVGTYAVAAADVALGHDSSPDAPARFPVSGELGAGGSATWGPVALEAGWAADAGYVAPPAQDPRGDAHDLPPDPPARTGFVLRHGPNVAAVFATGGGTRARVGMGLRWPTIDGSPEVVASVGVDFALDHKRSRSPESR